MTLYSEAIVRADEYAATRSLSIQEQLGGGIQGVVYSTTNRTAIKSLIRSSAYERERDVYLRLRENEIEKMADFWVPRLLDYDDRLQVIEMQIVSPPFTLDFASAYLDEPPPYAGTKEIMRQWESEKRAQFEDRWPIVKSLMSDFRRIGIHLADVKPGNITFAN